MKSIRSKNGMKSDGKQKAGTRMSKRQGEIKMSKLSLFRLNTEWSPPIQSNKTPVKKLN